MSMPVREKKRENKDITVVRNMKDYSADPLVIKKAEEAKSFLKRNGLPADFSKKKK